MAIFGSVGSGGGGKQFFFEKRPKKLLFLRPQNDRGHGLDGRNAGDIKVLKFLGLFAKENGLASYTSAGRNVPRPPEFIINVIGKALASIVQVNPPGRRL